MNITGSVILGLLYVLPGILFVTGLTRLFSTKTPSPFDGQLSSGIILALPAAVLMHVIGLSVTYLLAWISGSPEPDLAQALTMLLGDPKSEAATQAIAATGKRWGAISAYFVLLSIFSFVSGKAVNKRIKQHRRADWYDLLSHEADMLWLTTDMQIGGAAYLFAGMLRDFKVSADGALERVVLIGAVRRTLKRPTASEIQSSDENYEEGGWISIPGEYVVLDMKNSHTVNVDYWYLEKEEPEDETGQPDTTSNT